jgi:hypothetical protein
LRWVGCLAGDAVAELRDGKRPSFSSYCFVHNIRATFYAYLPRFHQEKRYPWA